MPTTIYLITSVTPSGGSANYDYVIDTGANYTGTFSFGPGVTNDGDEVFEGGEELFYTVGNTVYIVSYDGFVDVNATSSTDFGALTVDSVYSVNGDTNNTTDALGIVGSQFAFTDDGSVPSEANRAQFFNPGIGLDIPGLVCFALGTMILTQTGPRPIEVLKIGDKVATLDHGLQAIRWIGLRHVSVAEMIAEPKLRAIPFKASAFGNGIPRRDLVVSQQHRILVRSKIAQRMFGVDEVFSAAKHLLELDGADIAEDILSLTYFHVMCDEHEILDAEGAMAESLYTGQESIKAMTADARDEIAMVFGTAPYLNRPTARMALKGRHAKQLAMRHAKNHKALQAVC